MRRGCIATGEIKCDGCNRVIGHGERYLVMEEDDKLCLCIDCCLSRDCAAYSEEKGERVLTFFPPKLDSSENLNDNSLTEKQIDV